MKITYKTIAEEWCSVHPDYRLSKEAKLELKAMCDSGACASMYDLQVLMDLMGSVAMWERGRYTSKVIDLRVAMDYVSGGIDVIRAARDRHEAARDAWTARRFAAVQ